jgi:autoinducer 2 (AI-2) kinase
VRALCTADLTDEGLALLRRHAEVVYEPWSKSGTLLMAEELAERVKNDAIDLLVVEVDLVHEEVFDARPLRAVGVCRGEPLNVDVDTATERGVPVVHAPGRNAASVAELAIAFILCLARGIVPTHLRLTSGAFDPSDMRGLVEELDAMRGFELASATIALSGLGAVGRETARRLRAFGCRLIAYDPHVEDDLFAELGVQRVDLDALFREADVLSLHCALTDETRGIVSAERIASMKPGAFLVNTARHQLVDERALYAALSEGRIAGAGLDVFKSEPPTKDDPFLKLPNVIATPHIGGATRDVVRHQTEMVIGDLDRILRGERPLHCVNPGVLAAR